MFRGYKGYRPKPEDVEGHFQRDISSDETDWILSKFRHYLFIDDREERRGGTCSACRAAVQMSYRTTHNETAVCPSCGKALEVKHIWRGTRVCGQTKIFFLYEKSVKDPNIIGCRSIVATLWPEGKEFADQCAAIALREDSLTLFVYGYGAMQVEKEAWNRETWIKTTTVTGRKSFYSLWEKDAYLDTESVHEAIEGTPFAWSNWSEFHAANTYGFSAYIKLFDLFAKREAMEYLLKLGFYPIIWTCIWGGHTFRSINWHGKTPNEIFKTLTTKADRKFLQENAKRIQIAGIRNWATVNRMGKRRYSLEEISSLLHGRVDLPKRLFQYVPIRKAFDYLKKQRAAGGHGRLQDYDDYIRQCEALHMDMKSKSTLYPRNLMQAHENLSRQIEYQKNQALEEKWAKRKDRLKKKYAFQSDGCAVIVPEHISELVVEGKRQRNCVGGYMKRVADGETDVVFIRHTDAPDESYITMEVRNGRIVQARTKYNNPPDEKGRQFVEAFRREKLEKKQKRVRITA